MEEGSLVAVCGPSGSRSELLIAGFGRVVFGCHLLACGPSRATRRKRTISRLMASPACVELLRSYQIAVGKPDMTMYSECTARCSLTSK